MNEPTMDKMEQRLDRLERENRWMKSIGTLVVVGIAAVVLMGQAKPRKVPKVIEAEQFRLMDPDGKIRAHLYYTTTSGSNLDLIGDKTYATLNAGSSASLTLRTNKLGDDSPMNSFEDVDKKIGPYATLTADLTGTELRMQAGLLQSRVLLRWNRKHGAQLNLSDKDGNNRAVLGSTSLETTRTGTVTKTAESSLVLFDKKGKVIWSAP